MIIFNKYITGILLLILLVEIIFRPRLDITKEGDLFLWYGHKKRKYIKII